MSKTRIFTMINLSPIAGLPCQAQVIYFWLCKYADSKTKQCYPSTTTLSRNCGLSQKTVIKYLKKLENKGLIKIEKRKSDKSNYDNNLYTVFDSVGTVRDTVGTVRDTVGTVRDTVGVLEEVQLGVLEEVQPNYNQYINYTNITKGEGGDISEWWSLYPRKEAKQKAIQAWNKLSTKDKQKALEALPKHLTREQWSKDNGKYIPLPASWINARRWEDELSDCVDQDRAEFIRLGQWDYAEKYGDEALEKAINLYS